MADVDIVAAFEHLVTYPTPIHGEDLADHQWADGLSAEGYALVYRGSASGNKALSNNGRALVNAPLYMSLIVSATPIANTGTATVFDKTLVMPTGCLVAAPVNPAGVVLRVTAGGPISTKASSPGGIEIQVKVTAGGDTVTLASVFTSALIANESNRRWSVVGMLTIRASGVQPAAVSYILLVDPTGSTVVSSAGTSFDPALTPTVSVEADWVTGDAANSIGLDTLIAEVPRPGGTAT